MALYSMHFLMEGSDNRSHDAPSHNCMHDRIIIMLKLEKFEI